MEDLFKPLEKGPVSKIIIERITEALINGTLKPGDQIPTEVDFTQNLGVGRNSVREAIKVLEAFGVLEIRRSEGTFIVDEFNQKLMDPLVYGIIMKAKSMRELLEFKISFLRSILYLAIEKASEDSIQKLRDQYDLYCEVLDKDIHDIEKLYKMNSNFYSYLAEATENKVLIEMDLVEKKISKFSRIQGLTEAVNRNNIEMLKEIFIQILDILETRDVAKIEPFIQALSKRWKSLVL